MKTAFTLIELLVVITIIVVLLALLSPALDRALQQAERLVCMTNLRTQVQGCQSYALQFKRVIPPSYYGAFNWGVPVLGGEPYALSVDLRNAAELPSPKVPLGIGLLADGQFLPQSQLGKVIHCPSNDTSSSGAGINYYGMDAECPDQNAAGGSWWVRPDYADVRIVSSYNYRSPSWQVQHNNGVIRANRIPSRLVLISDTADFRFGLGFTHLEGYHRAAADGSSGFMPDPERILEAIAMDDPATFTDGLGDPADCETIFQVMEKSQPTEADIR